MADPNATKTRTAAHDRILAVLEGHNVTQADVLTRLRRHAIGGPSPKADLASWSFGPGTVAAMLELVSEAMKDQSHGN